MKQRVKVAIGLGANLGDRLKTLNKAAQIIVDDFLEGSTCSPVYESKPWGIKEQPDFLNAVIVGESEWKPPAILNYLKAENVAGATVIHAVAGFTGRSRVKTTSLVDAGGKLPIILTFIDTDEHVQRVLPKLREMAAHRLIVRENVVIEQGSLE